MITTTASQAQHEAEFVDGRFLHRWTTGSTPLPAGAQIVVADLAGVGHFWQAREDIAMALFG